MSAHHRGGHHHDHSLEAQREQMSAETWDERYSASDRVWSGRPNQRLVEQAEDLAPGTALDVACGEGADAIWLAGRGWQVTAVDVSEVALERVAVHAREEGVDDRVRIGFYDALADPRPAHHHTFDLVTVSFLHPAEPDFEAIYAGIAQAVAPGGRLLVVAHHPEDVATGARHDHGPGRLFEPERLLHVLGADRPDGPWEVEAADMPERVQHTPDGPLAVRDTVVRLRRR